MNSLDYIIVAAYLSVMLWLGFSLRKHKGEGDYFLGGRSMDWRPLSLSTMATQLSTISFISAPAFVGLRENGGLKWLTYEFSLPLAMILVAFVIMPALYRAGLISIYEYLERRFSKLTRVFISIAFQIARCFATAIMVYATGIIIESVLGIPFWQSIAVIGVITLVYSLSGGMKAVVYTDAIQMILVIFGLLLCLIFALGEIGGFSNFINQVDPERLKVADFSSYGFSGDQFGFWPMLFGGFVLYASYYGCDQTQAQRALSAKSLDDTRKLFLTNGLLRFPITLLYCFTGLAIGVVAVSNTEFLATIPEGKPDYLMPLFILEFLPHGIIGLLLVAILSAAMSSLSSGINSLAAVTTEDLTMLGFKAKDQASEMRQVRYVALFWGLVTLLLSAFAGNIAPTIIEAINKVGSAMYGPVLAVFLIGILTKRVGASAVNAGLIVGLLVNIMLWKFAPNVFWMWWNLIGLLVALSVAFVTQLFVTRPNPDAHKMEDVISDSISPAAQSKTTIVLVLFFVVILVVSVSLNNILSS